MEKFQSNRPKVIGVLTLVSAALSTTLLIITVSGDHWIACTEVLKVSSEELQQIVPNISAQGKNLYTHSYFGLWRACSQITNEDKIPIPGIGIKCRQLDFKPEEDGAASETDDTIIIAITRNMQLVSIMTMLGLSLELIADVACVFGYRLSHKKALIFLTGVLFVLAGLIMLAGIILFMGAVTGESAHQPKVGKDETPVFRYTYASSFAMLTIAFTLDELAAVLSVYLFIIRYKDSVRRRQARLHVIKSSELLNKYLKRRRSHIEETNSLKGASWNPSRRPSFLPNPVSEYELNQISKEYSRHTITTNVPSMYSISNIETSLADDPRAHISQLPFSDMDFSDLGSGDGIAISLLNAVPAIELATYEFNDSTRTDTLPPVNALDLPEPRSAKNSIGSLPSPVAPPTGFDEMTNYDDLPPPIDYNSHIRRNGSLTAPPDGWRESNSSKATFV